MMDELWLDVEQLNHTSHSMCDAIFSTCRRVVQRLLRRGIDRGMENTIPLLKLTFNIDVIGLQTTVMTHNRLSCKHIIVDLNIQHRSRAQ